ncbi:MAG: CxxxxCH/CxxCH domain-containing protein [Myxococcota bacterium]
MKPAAITTLLLLLLGCTRAGPVEGTRRCVHWKDDVRVVVEARCIRCHSGQAAAAGYDMFSYNGVLGGGSDGNANAVAGDPRSTLLEAVRPGAATGPHVDHTDVHSLLEEWVVDCSLSYSGFGIHEGGIANPADQDFHGRKLRESGWDMSSCARCHGEDFRGGNANASCYGCHVDGPTGCTTCHSQDPTSGAHATHASGPVTGRSANCTACHKVPTNWRAPGHIFLADGSLDPAPVEVTFGPGAMNDVHPERRAGPAAWDGVGCSNIACHGATLGDSSVADRTFNWQEPTRNQGCLRCHGAPPSSHQHSLPCLKCHEQVVDGSNALVDRALHLNGVVEVGPAGGNCQACHQDAPFRDTHGGNDAATRPVGAHEVHLTAPHQLSAPLKCADCHRTPATPGETGHLDSDLPAEVFAWRPREPGLAAARGAEPVYDVATGGCAATYCHGGGEVARLDTSPSILRNLTWTSAGQGLVYCGSCHGIPPADPNHDDTMTSLQCVNCHAGSVDRWGRIIINPDGTSLHLNGVANATP